MPESILPEGELVVIDEVDDPLLFPATMRDALEARMATLFHEGLGLLNADACVLIVDDAAIQALNQTWRGEGSPTDVLSFPTGEGIGAELAYNALGDIVISIPYAARLIDAGAVHRARVAAQLGVAPALLSWSLLDELTFLMVHGSLHLIGYDHATPEQEALMKAEETRLMRLLLGLDPKD